MDLIIIASYLLITLFVGIYSARSNKTLQDFSRIGSDLKNNKIILTATIFASAVGGGTTFGITEKSYSSNLAFAYGLMLTIPIDLLIAKYIVPKLSSYNNFSTPGEIIAKFYGKKAGIITGISSFLISIGYLSVQIGVSGKIFSYIMGIDYLYALLISYVIVISYTSFGGFRSVVINNLLQFIAMIIAIPVITIISIKHFGITELLKLTPPSKYNIFKDSDLIKDTIYATLSFAVMGLHPSFIQRVLSGASAGGLKSAIYIKTAVYFLFIACLGINGIIASLISKDSNSSEAILALIDYMIAPEIRGFIIVGLLAAVMSTADSDLNISSLSIVNDVLKPLGLANKENILTIAKITTILVGSSVILIVLNFKNIIDIVIFSAGFWTQVSAVPLVGILLDKPISRSGYYKCVILGSISFILLEIFLGQQAISNLFVATLISAVSYIISRISLSTFKKRSL
jgi:solute:Na+ symporter, SSS family